jgi:hypothetical protein
MPARVEYRLGSIFDEDCDILVIPTSAGGTVTPSMAEQLRKEGIAFPPAAPWGSVTYMRSPSPYYGALAYAATLRGQETTPEIVRLIGQHLGTLAAEHRARRISAPLLGAGAGDLPPAVVAEALSGGFRDTAPGMAVLTISIRKPDVFAMVRGKKNGDARGDHPFVPRYRINLLPRDRRAPLREPASPAKPIPTAKPTPAVTPAPAPTPAPEPAVVRSQPPAVRTPPVGTRVMGLSRPVRKRTRVFISYSHADVKWLKRLQLHLRPLERDGALVWDDTRLKAGSRWREEIRQALDETRVAVLLVSAAFIASDFINTDELPPLLKAAEEDGAIILPVIISASRFDRMESLSRFEAVNDPRKPLAKLPTAAREEMLDKVARAVEDALKQ